MENSETKAVMKDKPVKLHLVNDAEAIKEQLDHWGHSHLLAGPLSEQSGAGAVRKLQKPFKGHTVVASLILYRSRRRTGVHVEMAYALCDTPLQMQSARQAIDGLMQRVKSSLYLPVDVLLSRGRN